MTTGIPPRARLEEAQLDFQDSITSAADATEVQNAALEEEAKAYVTIGKGFMRLGKAMARRAEAGRRGAVAMRLLSEASAKASGAHQQALRDIFNGNDR